MKRILVTGATGFIDQAIQQGVKRFIQTSSVVIAPLAREREAPPVDDFSLARHYTGFWPHVDRLMDLDRSMRQQASERTQLITMRLGHFVGVRNTSGLLPMLVPRLRTHMVPWLAGGHMRLPIVSGEDMGRAFALAAVAEGLIPQQDWRAVVREQLAELTLNRTPTAQALPMA